MPSAVPYLFLRFPPYVHENNSSPLSASPFSLQPASWWIAVSWRWSVPSAACQQAAFRRSQTPCTSPTSSSSARPPGHLAPPARWPAACLEQTTTPWWSAHPSTLTRSSCRWCPSTAGRSSSSSMTPILVRIFIGVENSRYSAYQTLQPDFCQRLPRYSWSSVRIHQNLHSVSGYLYENETVRLHFCKHTVGFIYFTLLFSMAVFRLFSRSINSTLDQRHLLFPASKCIFFSFLTLKAILQVSALPQVGDLRSVYTHLYTWAFRDHVYMQSFSEWRKLPWHGRLGSEKVLTPLLLLSNFLVCNWLLNQKTSSWQMFNENYQSLMPSVI